MLAVLVVLAGCGAAERETVTATAAPATVPADAARGAGYAPVAAEDRRLNATLAVELEGDISVTERVDVRATVPVHTYARADGAGRVAVAASPLVTVVENPRERRDPLGTLSTPELVDVLLDRRVDVERAGEGTVRTLGTEATLAAYEGTADGAAVTVRVVRVEHGDAVVTVVGVAPAGSDAGPFRELLRALEH